MSPEERYYLDAFLRRILLSDDFSYVLFGSKPCAFTSYSKTTSFNVLCDGLTISDIKIRQGLEVFRKYQLFFQSNNFIIIFYDYPNDLDILLINKKTFSLIFNRYKNDFEQVLGPQITDENLLTHFAESDELGDAIKNHQALLGILLGYGRNNAWLFHNRTTAERGLDEFNLCSKKQALLEKKITEINQKLKFFSIDPPNHKSFLKRSLIELPHFMADSSSIETKELKETYEKDREKMKNIFAKQNLIEATFQQLIDK